MKARLLAAILVLLSGACNGDGGGSGGGSGGGPGGGPGGGAAAGTLAFSSATYSVGEAGPVATLTVRRIGGAAGAVGVFVAAAPGGTAVAGQDYPHYIDYVATLQWADGDAADKTFTIPILEDALQEPDETLSLSLALPIGGASLGTPSVAVLTIVDNDWPSSPGTLQFSSAQFSVNEDAGLVTVTATRRGGSLGAVGVFVSIAAGGVAVGTATAGQDYPQYFDYVAYLRWADGDVTDKSFTVPILNDALKENSETIVLSLGGPTGGSSLGTPHTTVVTILDND